MGNCCSASKEKDSKITLHLDSIVDRKVRELEHVCGNISPMDFVAMRVFVFSVYAP